MSDELLLTILRALRAGDLDLVRVHASALCELLEELRRLRTGGDLPDVCPRCFGRGTSHGLAGAGMCPDCDGEGFRRASTR